VKSSKKTGGPDAPEGAGIHPLPPGALATGARVGTQGRAELNSLGGSVVA